MALDDIIRELEKNIAKLQTVNKPRGRIILTGKEIITWLEKEQSFPKAIATRLSDDGYRKNQSDEDLTEPFQIVVRVEEFLNNLFLDAKIVPVVAGK